MGVTDVHLVGPGKTPAPLSLRDKALQALAQAEHAATRAKETPSPESRSAWAAVSYGCVAIANAYTNLIGK